MKYPIIIFDTETGGLKPGVHPVLEIAAVKLCPETLDIIGRFHSYCGPEKGGTIDEIFAACHPKALEVNGLDSKKHLFEKCGSCSSVLKNFISWATSRATITCYYGGQNVNYDINMVNGAIKKFGFRYQIPKSLIKYELKDMAKQYFTGKNILLENYKLESIARGFGFGTEGLHGAVQDVIITTKCITKIVNEGL